MSKLRCPSCKKVYEFSGLPPKQCPECYLSEEGEFQVVRDFVWSHPGINIVDTSEKTGVPVTKIMRYLREDRLEGVPSATVFLNCKSCGKIINTGTYCPDCGKNRDGVFSAENTSNSPDARPGRAQSFAPHYGKRKV